MKTGRGAKPGTVRTVPGWIKILVAVHVFASIVWALPAPPQAVAEGRIQPHATLWILYWNNRYLKNFEPLRGYILSLGAWQYWDMFAPDPANTDWYCTAEVTYRDGTKKSVAYPRIYDLPIPMKYVKERYRKYFERAKDDKDSRTWPVFAQAIALQAYDDPRNPPLVVRLTRHWYQVAPPGEPQPKDYSQYEYYAYAVDLKRLRQAAGER